MLNKIKNVFAKFRRVKWTPINEILVGKDNIFQMKFDKNWFYNVTGNSFYSIHNEVDGLKGGIQISIIWKKPVVYSINDLAHLDRILQENENAKTTRTIISGMEAIFFMAKYIDNNLDIYYWYLRFDNVYIKISYFIYEEEPLETREIWLHRVSTIINSIEINREKFKTIKMD
jgi:hypothetical protein